jgi:nicotinate-nucleotide pyrophosphorylase (carboxylating)
MAILDERLEHLITEALSEDTGDGDHTTLSCIPPQQEGKAILKIKDDGILAGVDIAHRIFSHVESAVSFAAFKKDGDAIQNGDTGFEISGHIHTILRCERLVLNCMQRMSGIATVTRKYVEKLAGYKTKLLDTRKTTPNFRLLEKEAVRIGGGFNHRFGLFDMIMLKDNHIDYCGGIEKAIDRAWAYVQEKKPGLKIEIETRNVEDVRKVCAAGRGKVFRIMLDNFTPEQISGALNLIDHDFETEASGGINLENIGQYAATGVDYVSVGGLIHQAQSLDLSLKAVIT